MPTINQILVLLGTGHVLSTVMLSAFWQFA